MPRILRVIVVGKDYESMALEMSKVQQTHGDYKVEAMDGTCVILYLTDRARNMFSCEEVVKLEKDNPYWRYVFDM